MPEEFDSIREFLSLILALVMTSVLPLAVSFLKQNTWSTGRKQALSLVLAVGVGILTVAVNGNLTGENLTLAITAVFTASNTIYHQFFKDSRLDQTLEMKGAHARTYSTPDGRR